MSTYTGQSQIVEAGMVKIIQIGAVVSNFGMFTNPILHTPAGQYWKCKILNWSYSGYGSSGIFLGTDNDADTQNGNRRITTENAEALDIDGFNGLDYEFTMDENERMFLVDTAVGATLTSYKITIYVERYNKP